VVLSKQTYNNQDRYKKPKDIHKKPQFSLVVFSLFFDCIFFSAIILWWIKTSIKTKPNKTKQTLFFSRLLRHPARQRIGPILTKKPQLPEPARGRKGWEESVLRKGRENTGAEAPFLLVLDRYAPNDRHSVYMTRHCPLRVSAANFWFSNQAVHSRSAIWWIYIFTYLITYTWKWTYCPTHTLAAWLSGNALVLINVVALRRARLVLGWVTVRRYTILVFIQSHPGLLSLAIPPWVGTMSTCGGLGHRYGRNGEFGVTVVLYQDCWHTVA